MPALILVTLLPIRSLAGDTQRCRGPLLATDRDGAPGIDSLLATYRSQTVPNLSDGRRLIFTGVDGKTVYNPTAPFEIGGTRVIAARVESKDSERDSQVVFFRERNGVFSPVEEAPRFALQDPFHALLGAEHVIGGVETFEKGDGTLGYRTVFYRGTSLGNLHRFAQGPDGMKDIRMARLPDGRILVLTRPQGTLAGTTLDAGPGRIGHLIIRNLSELTPKNLASAPLLDGLFLPNEWGGANELHLLENATVGVLMHIARWGANGEREYYAGAFTFDPAQGTAGPVQVILARSQLPGGLKGDAKKPDLANVIFSGGLVRHGNARATLYVGAGDAEVHSIEIDDPFRTQR